jgi:hypothetical protein
MKKQLLIAAVAASMTSVAMADVSISGAAKANSTNGVASIETDLKVVGKSGDTSVIANISLDTGMNVGEAIVEDLYMTSSFEGVNIKVGEYRSGKSELDQTSAAASTRYNLSTSMGGITATYEATKDAHNLTLGGSVAGVSVKHKMFSSDNTETWVSGSMSGVNVAWNQEHNDANDTNDTAITVSTDFSGVTATYVKIDAEGAVSFDGYVGKDSLVGGEDATALGLSTSVAGNTVTFKKITIADVDSNKLILNRKLASGAVFEATYTNNDVKANTLDLELAVKF